MRDKELRKRVVIVGQGPRAFEHPPDAEVWAINGPRFPPRWDVLFQLHGLEHIAHKHGEGFIRELAAIKAPRVLIMTKTHERMPRALPFPLGRLTAFDSYLTGSFALVLAFAIGGLRGEVSEIILDGVMFAGGSAQWGAGEGWAVPCIEYHIGRARALGIAVACPKGCGLFEHSDFIYGFEGPGAV